LHLAGVKAIYTASLRRQSRRETVKPMVSAKLSDKRRQPVWKKLSVLWRAVIPLVVTRRGWESTVASQWHITKLDGGYWATYS